MNQKISIKEKTVTLQCDDHGPFETKGFKLSGEYYYGPCPKCSDSRDIFISRKIFPDSRKLESFGRIQMLILLVRRTADCLPQCWLLWTYFGVAMWSGNLDFVSDDFPSNSLTRLLLLLFDLY